MAKESKYGIGKTPVFRETFNSEQEVKSRVYSIGSEITFSEGKAICNTIGTGKSHVEYFHPILVASNYTVRIRFTLNDFNSNYWLMSYPAGTGNFYMYLQINTGTIVSTVGTKYINGAVASKAVIGKNEFVLNATGVFAETIVFLSAGNYGVNYLGTCDLIELYEDHLTAEEVANLYNNSAYIKPTFPSLLEVSAETGVIQDRLGSSITNTDVAVVRDGGQWVSRYLSQTDYLTLVSSPDLSTINFTMSIWVKTTAVGSIQVLYSWQDTWADGVLFRIETSGVIKTYLNSSAGTSSEVVVNDKWVNIVVTVDKSALLKYYFNSVFDNSTNVSPAGTMTVVTPARIGLRAYAANNPFIGRMGEFIITEGVWTAEQVSQYYTSTKFKYTE